ncbi:hypothetical protein QTG54_002878 [Skeletonema marinoi]|uniref:Uncharacterized protein n=1 Tax=Skeletonema marinoi TaxID=267567 RepID=A0AAD8YGU2_9STRA|nr:hypothetical protein QTG54_002878 [Skeletonema marinoi]
MSAVDKLPYERMAIDDKGRYTEEKAAYDAKNKSVAESNNKVGGGTSVPLSYPVKMGEHKHDAPLTHARGVDNASDVKMKYAEVINTEVVFKKEVNVANNDVPSSASQKASQKSPESVDVDLLVDPQEKIDSLKKEQENDVPLNNGNKENNNAPSSKVGKGLKGLGKSLAKAKSGVTRLFNSKSKSQEEEKSSKSRTVVCAGSYTAVVKKSGSSKDPVVDAKVNSGQGASGKSHSGETEGDKKNDFLQRKVEMKLKDDTNAMQANLNQATAQLRLNSSNDDDDDEDGTGSQQSADLLSGPCEDEGTPITSNTSNKSPKKVKAKTTSSDPPQAPANLARLAMIPLNRDDCASALKKLKGCPHEEPNYVTPVPEKDQNTVRNTIVLEEKDDANSHTTSLGNVTLGRSS